MSRVSRMPTMVGLCAVVAVVTAGFVGSARAHEFWIEPLDFTVPTGEAITAQNRIGQMLKGDVDPYIKSLFQTFTLTDEDGTRDVPGRLGDRPALNMKPRREGLHIAAFQSKPSILRYRKQEKFAKFARKEGFAWALEAHEKRGLPKDKFREAYTRFAKSLIAVGEGAGNDRALGLRIELVALTNPYLDPGPMRVQVLFEKAPLADVQIAIFRRDAENDVTRETLRTDDEGRAVIPEKGAATTLLSAVHLVEPDEDLATKRKVVWHSLWASLTYGAP